LVNHAGLSISYSGYASATGLGYSNSIMGDADDVLMLTVRSQGEPFVGNMAGTMIESATAEVIWFALPNGRTLPADPAYGAGHSVQLYTVYRRALLINPTYFDANSAALSGLPPTTLQKTHDLSVRPVYKFAPPPPLTVPPTPASPPTVTGCSSNTLSTLAARENRYYHPNSTASGAFILSGFPFSANTTSAPFSQSIFSVVNPMRIGEDVILTDVLSFDIRVFDPLAALKLAPDKTTVVTPGDPGYPPMGTTVGYGAFVDMGYYAYFPAGGSTIFSARPWGTNAAGYTPTAMPGLTSAANLLPSTYDTWSLSYEQNGIDEDDDASTAVLNSINHTGGAIDEGTDGLDDDPGGQHNGIIDDPPQVHVNYAANPPTASIVSVGERETLAPYPFPLRGVQIRIRVYDPDTRQIREMKVVQDFLPD
jgi:hypothetical protein